MDANWKLILFARNNLQQITFAVMPVSQMLFWCCLNDVVGVGPHADSAMDMDQNGIRSSAD